MLYFVLRNRSFCKHAAIFFGLVGIDIMVENDLILPAIFDLCTSIFLFVKLLIVLVVGV